MKEFPPFRLDTVNQCLLQGDGVAEERMLLAPKAFDVLRYLVARGADVYEFTPERQSLEELFLEIVGGDGGL